MCFRAGKRGDLLMISPDAQRVLDICIALTSERDREILLSTILDTAMDLARCDAGTLYLLQDNTLHFCRMFTRSRQIRQGGHEGKVTLPPVPMEETYVCGCCAIHGEIISIADVYDDRRFDFFGTRQYDSLTGYRTQSMLVIPMNNEKGELIGVLQLINAMDRDGTIIPFDPDAENLLCALASQAAISIANRQYTEQITVLLDSLVQSFSKAVDERSPYTANHSRTMAALAEQFLNWLEQHDHPWAFSPEKRRAFLMAVLLHDTGKLAIPLEVMDKDTRLSGQLAVIEERFRVMGLLDRVAALENRISPEEHARRNAERAEKLARIRRINRAGFLPDEDLAFVRQLAEKYWTDENGQTQPWITEYERSCLEIRKGTLTADERETMQSHVAVTEKILASITFPREYARVPEWASSHHEFLNGRGYTKHLSEGQLSPETRLLTILDIFEALTAKDRPYKKPMPLDKALLVLENMAKEGCLDGAILQLFRESRAWEGII